jgi:hypothetical protein
MSNNTNYGVSSLNSNIGSNNTAVGAYSSYSNLAGDKNTAVGSNSSFYNTTGTDNTALGAGSLCNNTTGSLNTAVGSSALEGQLPEQSVGDHNVAIGAQALYSNTGNFNTAIGTFAAFDVTTGSNNTFLGGNTTTDGLNTYNHSTAVGYNAEVTSSNQIMMGGDNGSGVYPEVVANGGITQLPFLGFQSAVSTLSPQFKMSVFTYTNSSLTLAPGGVTNIPNIHFNSPNGSSSNQISNFVSSALIFLNISNALQPGGAGMNEASLTVQATSINLSNNTFTLDIRNNAASGGNTCGTITVQGLVIGY